MMRESERSPPRRQRGWVGLVVLLIALVIVGMLMKTVLQQYGLTGKAGPASKATQLDAVSPDPSHVGAAPPPGNAIERARGLEANVQQQANDLSKRIDAATK